MMTMLCDADSLLGLWFDGQKRFDPARVREAKYDPELPAIQKTLSWLQDYFAGNPGEPPSVANLRITPFQRRVLAVVGGIGFGESMTYGQIAAVIGGRTGCRASARAVGGAVARNPVSIIIPCHRVLGSGGRIVGYAGGVFRKRWLLEHEGIIAFPPIVKS